ncbi:FecR family protein [Paraburkholderia bannensis]|uniref:FecR family protein n=1 Tax=Paraburkholderia bannensis TaxID=765414 RepID=UPI002AB67EEF|nr:FecR domain-containing protein [Paraburkholderia bannensis]
MTKDFQPLGMPVSSSGSSTRGAADVPATSCATAQADARARRLRAEAAVWVVRIDAGRATRDDARLARWCARSPEHRAAFDAASSQWQHADALRARPAVRPNVSPAPTPAPRARFSFGFTAPHAAFACAFAAAGIGFALFLHAPDFTTTAGEVRTVALDDGSVMRLDADSAVDVRYDEHERRVVLERGRAAFDVKHGDARRFVVQAAAGEIVDIGTAFQASLPDRGNATAATLVTVTQGRVAVRNTAGSVEAAAGQSVEYRTPTYAPEPIAIDTFAATAWQRGRIVFTDAPLADVAATLNRYWKGHFIYVRGSAATLRVSGNFAIDAPGQALATLAETLSLHSTQIAGRVVILSSQNAADAD